MSAKLLCASLLKGGQHARLERLIESRNEQSSRTISARQSFYGAGVVLPDLRVSGLFVANYRLLTLREKQSAYLTLNLES